MTTYALLRPYRVEIIGDDFAPVFKPGSMVNLAGGVELLQTRSHAGYMYAIINDVRYPRVECRLPAFDVSPILITTMENAGRYTKQYLPACHHDQIDIDCETCWATWWRTEVTKHGIQVPPLVIS